MEQLKLYTIDMKYVRDLHNADDRVESVSPQIGKENRVFVGIVILHNGRKYCIPLSHPKEKHRTFLNLKKSAINITGNMRNIVLLNRRRWRRVMRGPNGKRECMHF